MWSKVNDTVTVEVHQFVSVKQKCRNATEQRGNVEPQMKKK